MSTYLDYNATAPVRPQVIERMQEIMAEPMNASSVHRYGRNAKKWLEDSRKIIAESISAFSNEIIFTATGTEANIMALSGFPDRRVLVSSVEHSSIIRYSRESRADVIPVLSTGLLNLDALDKNLASGSPALVSIQLANNETGIIQPIVEIAAICHKHGALLHTDAVQALGKIPVDFSLLGADMMTLSAHKFGGPIGAACLVVKQNLAIKPLFDGGQELGRRAGTENIAAIAGFARAVELIDLAQMKTIRNWLDGMEEAVMQHQASVIGVATVRLPNSSLIIMPSISSEVQLMNADLAGFAVSAGSACSSGRVESSHVLKAMGIHDDLASGAIRVSAGWKTTQTDILSYINYWEKTYCRLVKSSIVNG